MYADINSEGFPRRRRGRLFTDRIVVALGRCVVNDDEDWSPSSSLLPLVAKTNVWLDGGGEDRRTTPWLAKIAAKKSHDRKISKEDANDVRCAMAGPPHEREKKNVENSKTTKYPKRGVTHLGENGAAGAVCDSCCCCCCCCCACRW